MPRFIIPTGTVIPARGHFLGVNANGYSLTAYPSGKGRTATGDALYLSDIPVDGGIALFRTSEPEQFSFETRIDAAGFNTVKDPLYREGDGLTSFDGTTREHSYVRRQETGLPQDNENNSGDFVLVLTDGPVTNSTAPTTGGAGAVQAADISETLDIPSVLGAPGPENLVSPVLSNKTMPASLIDPTRTASAAPNRIRNTTPVTNGAQGTLTIRRRYTNNTGTPIALLRFRVIDISTQGNAANGQADVRLLSSANNKASLSNGEAIVVRGTKLEEPPVQRNGGGLNTSVTVESVTRDNPLVPGASVAVQFVLGVQTGGSYRFFVNVETEQL